MDFQSILLRLSHIIFIVTITIITLYISFILLLTIPSIQRHALYAHKVNTAYVQNLSNVEQFGFHQSQVQPFTLTTSDDIIIHAWHIIPTHLYLDHETKLIQQPSFNLRSTPSGIESSSPNTDCSLSFLHLLSDPSAHAIISFHGNAAHLASAYRPTTYQQLLGLSTPTRPIHVIAFDYRGFGLSSGSPTEAGLIEDGISVLSFITGINTPGSSSPPRPGPTIPPHRVILLGQSLGTAVSTAVYHKWTLSLNLPPPRSLNLLASFSSLPSLLNSYSVKGIIPPMLSPLDYIHCSLKPLLLTYLADTWTTSNRLYDLLASEQPLDLTILHARDDWEIPHVEGRRNFDALIPLLNTTAETQEMWKVGAGGGDVQEWESGNSVKRVRWELVRHGGHNRVAVGEQMKAAVLRSLDRERP